MSYDIVIIGGGIVGSSTAYHLARDGRAGEICVIEPDPTYEWAAAPRSSGGVRQLFSLPENIQMSQYGLAFYNDFPETMAVDGERAEIDFRHGGYLFLVEADRADDLEADYALQVSLGAKVEMMDSAGVKDRFPSLDIADVALATLSPEDGWLDAYSVVQGFRRKARSLGVTYLRDRATNIRVEGPQGRAVILESGGEVAGKAIVIAAGAWSCAIAETIGMALPVEPMPRLNHYFTAQAELEPMPLVKDITAMGFRPEGAGYIGGVAPWEVAGGFNWEIDHGYFERVVWPALAHRVPAFEAIKEERTWAGHYARNTLDGNMIMGQWIGGPENIYIATGFSGHGMMHSPAVGRALSELLLDGAFQTLDLSRMSYQRVVDNEPYAEKGIL
jgi:glycine/D-amino acid oxidase-like deaminating enzyme